uniref:Brix domain-containing protein n=1 Tax=Plectus sambesii TaxID=2011161 RepID=A0A914XIN7_9BILA
MEDEGDDMPETSQMSQSSKGGDGVGTAKTALKSSRKMSRMVKNEKGRAMRLQKAAAKRERQNARQKVRETLGEKAPPKEVPRTIENTREVDATMVEPEDEEVMHDEAHDEMAAYFNRETTPKVLITMSPYAKVMTWKFCYELRKCIPNSEIFSRKGVALKKVVKQATKKEYTDLIVVHEDRKKPNGIVLCHLPEGPTAYFKINSLKFSKEIKNVGESTSHFPEVILNNFNTRLGHTVARMFACLFPHDPKFTGRRVVTLHNQRDYVFFRHHRYEFKKDGSKAALLELGPRFTLRLKWLQKGTFDTRCGEYEWVLKRHEMETSRRRFFL